MTILSQAQIAGLAQQVGLSGRAMQIASAVAMGESGGDTNALNPGHGGSEYSVGLWQINLLAHPQYTEAQMKDPLQNAKAMYAISSGGTNWNPWGAYTNGRYLSYMTSTVVPEAYTSTTTSGAQSMTTNPAAFTDTGSGWKYILAYTVAIAIFIGLSKFKAGYAAIYYCLLLALMFLVITQAKFIYDALKPITGAPALTAGTSQTVSL